jgi:hypothetical protein
MSGGSNDDAVLAIAHQDADGRVVLDRVLNHGPPPPFDPRAAVTRFAAELKAFAVQTVTGDRYAGETFRRDFERESITYRLSDHTAHELYEALEPRLNAHRVVLLDVPALEQQLLGLIWKGGRITHPSGEHDDFANAVAGAVEAAAASGASEAEILSCLRAGELSRRDKDDDDEPDDVRDGEMFPDAPRF